jgi:hypothetical protein
MAKQARIDTVAEQVKVLVGMTKPIEVPPHVPLEEDDMPFWHSVIAEFARVEWTDHQLELAAMLARAMADLTQEMINLRIEGSVVTSEKGTPVINPRKTAVQMYASTILSFRRSLSLHALGKTNGAESRDIGNRRKQAKEVENQAGDNGNPVEDDLISHPMHG